MIKKRNIIGCLLGLVVMLSACTISYKFNGASIDYTKVKSISIKDFPNQAPLVYAPLAQLFTEERTADSSAEICCCACRVRNTRRPLENSVQPSRRVWT